MNRFRHFLEYAALSSERKYQLLRCVSWTNMSVEFLESIGRSLMISFPPVHSSNSTLMLVQDRSQLNIDTVRVHGKRKSIARIRRA